MATVVKGTDAPKPLFDRISYFGFMTGIVVLAFLGGLLAAVNRLNAYVWVEDATRAASALWEANELRTDEFLGSHWTKLDRAGSGVTQYIPGEAFEGYTLYIDGFKPEARLIDMDGHVVHEWAKPFRDVWPDPQHVSEIVTERHLMWRRVHVFPEGQILAFYETGRTTPCGHGMVKLDTLTVQRVGIMIYLQLVANLDWFDTWRKGDFSSAFSQGQERDTATKGRLFLEPPKRPLSGVAAGDILEVIKSVYGLPDAPRAWWEEFTGLCAEN